MPLRTNRPAPPPPAGGSRAQNISRSSNFKSHLSNNNEKSVSRPTVIRPGIMQAAKKKPPPRPAPPKNYQGKAGGLQKSAPPDLLADLRDIFTTPINPSQSNPTVLKPFGSTRSSFKKTPAPARPQSASFPSHNQTTSLIDFDTPSTTTQHANHKAQKSNSAILDLFQLDPFFSQAKSSNSKNNGTSNLLTLATNNPNATKKVASSAWTMAVNNPKATKSVASTLWNMHNSTNKPSKSTSVVTTVTTTHTVENFVSNNWNNEKSKSISQVKSNVTPSKSFPDMKSISKVLSPPEPMFPPPPPPPVGEEDSLSPPISPCSNCKALYDFVANDPDEISFNAGDIIELINKPSEDWWLGSLNGSKGLFPSTFVQVLPQNDHFTDQTLSTCRSDVQGCFVKALYTFEAEQEGDLPFWEGDDIEVMYRINQNWLFGKCKGKEGQFPSNFVQKSGDNENNFSSCLAKYHFQAENSDELSFKEGDCIIIIEKLSSEWWKGYLQSDKTKSGIFPSSFVEV